MNSSKKITLEDVRQVAELASLELTQEEEAHMQRDLNSILDYVAQLNQLNTTDVPAMAQVSEILSAQSDENIKALREDTRRPSLDRAAVFSFAPETDGVYFKVPKVIER
ncbi:MAG TPA: Asp-tRNA(Asn)/Glu-tRNA(Gln) amidotransferase subunit GatC [Acidobacteriaceae bacterium]|jgi:aspartyl-tRNA(Asn)/glutamyl-tRNA(Gln) amidotransferase subunit C|nr:Asp-tRNA(Asn)/Glu-tRNA(Gln) amidotransferase subunit GatC [Acidobacteriaceae bacterium]